MRVRRGAALVGAAVLLAGCASGCASGPGGDTPDETAPAALARVDGWREQVVGAESDDDLLELAYDAGSARRMWDENVTADLPRRDGTPLDVGVYGDLDDVDLMREVVALLSSAQSGGCPELVSGARTDAGGAVTVTTAQDLRGGDGCNESRVPFRLLIVLDRTDLPAQDAVPGTVGFVDAVDAWGGTRSHDLRVALYPAVP